VDLAARLQALRPLELPPWLWHMGEQALGALVHTEDRAEPVLRLPCPQCDRCAAGNRCGCSTSQALRSGARRTFTTPNGLKAHVHMVHTLQVVEMAAPPETHACPTCGTVYRKAGALERHIITKHGVSGAADTEPHTAAARLVELDGPRADDAIVCALCGLAFACADALAAHMARLVPVEESHVCGGCARAFGNARALQQHAARCKPVD